MWICRTWKCKNGDWTSEFDGFVTEAEAKEHGRIFVENICMGEDGREYEVYRG